MSGMAEVLGEHADWGTTRGEVHCAGCDWSQRISDIDPADEVFHTHQAEMLTAAGYRKPRSVRDTHADDGPDSLRPLSVILSGGRPAIKGFDGTFMDYDGSTWDFWELETPIVVLHEPEAAA